MNIKTPLFYALLAMLATFSCNEQVKEEDGQVVSQDVDVNIEKDAILATLNNETIAAFSRDYDKWQDHWVHRDDVTKTYMQFTDSTMTETLGWTEIDHFVKTYFEEHPEPDPLPEPLVDIDVRVYGDGAWVSYRQQDPARGLKRETRLMEKVNGQWKIAGMHTSIYGFNETDQ